MNASNNNIDSIEKEKYYTPEMEEFHIGFEYEYLDPLRNLVNWTEKIVENKFNIPSEQSLLNLYRVKLLDSDDISSFEFNRGQLSYQYFKGDRYFMIDLKDGIYSIADQRYQDQIFRGKIKNKSELKRILNQLDIL